MTKRRMGPVGACACHEAPSLSSRPLPRKKFSRPVIPRFVEVAALRTRRPQDDRGVSWQIGTAGIGRETVPIRARSAQRYGSLWRQVKRACRGKKFPLGPGGIECGRSSPRAPYSKCIPLVVQRPSSSDRSPVIVYNSLQHFSRLCEISDFIKIARNRVAEWRREICMICSATHDRAIAKIFRRRHVSSYVVVSDNVTRRSPAEGQHHLQAKSPAHFSAVARVISTFERRDLQ